MSTILLSLVGVCVVLLLVFVVLFLKLLGVAQDHRESQREAWRSVGRELGLVADRSGRMRGRRHGRDVAMWIESGEHGEVNTIVAISGPPTGLHLVPARRAAAQRRDDAVGDPGFDRAWTVRIDHPAAWAALHADARGWLQHERARLRPRVQKGWLRVELGHDLGAIREGLAKAEALAAQLDPRGPEGTGTSDPAAVLRRVVASDPQPVVRANALRALLQQIPRTDGEAVARHALVAETPEVVQVAAQWLQDAAGLRRVACWQGASRSVRRDALAALLTLDAPEETAAALDALFADDPRDPTRGLWREACRLVAQTPRPGLSGPIVRLVHGLDLEAWSDRERYRREREVALWAARALGQQEGDVEGALLTLLSAPDMEVRVAAADALARVGTAASVPELQRVSAGALPLSAARTRAQEAIASIQGRAGAGSLALAEVGAGALAEARTGGALAAARARATERLP